MENTYRRYRELKRKAKAALESKYGTASDHLTTAVNELSYLNESDIPEVHRSTIKEIIDSCRTTDQKKDEGIFRASIDAMTPDQRQKLRERISFL